jgi:hypothetical protein
MLWSVTGTFWIWNQTGKVGLAIDEIVSAPDAEEAIIKATDAAFWQSGSTELHDETTDEVDAVELTGERLTAYESNLAAIYQSQHGSPLWEEPPCTIST